MTRPEAVISEEAPKNEELIPREEPKVEPEVKVKDIIKPKAIKKSKKEVVIPKPKHKEDAARPDDAIAKMREKVAAEEAVERIRKKVSEKEPTSSGGIKIATKAPAKVYHYEELDDEMKAYYATIRQIIRNAWILPDELRNKGYKAELAIKVLKDGTVQGSWIYKKSGNNYFDDTAVRAINKVTTLPPLPDGWKEGSIDFGFYFPYKENIERNRMNRLLILTLACFFGNCFSADAKVYIDIGLPDTKTLPIAIPTLHSAEGEVGVIASKVTEVIVSDLETSGILDILDKAIYPSDPLKAELSPEMTDFKPWFAIGAEALVKGRLLWRVGI